MVDRWEYHKLVYQRKRHCFSSRDRRKIVRVLNKLRKTFPTVKFSLKPFAVRCNKVNGDNEVIQWTKIDGNSIWCTPIETIIFHFDLY